MRETWIWSLGWKDPLEKGKATHFSILAWRIPWTVEFMGSQRVGQDWVTFTFTFEPSLWSNSHIHTWLLGKTVTLTVWTLVGQMMSLLFNTLSRFVIAFLPRSKYLWILWLQSPSTLNLEPKKMKSDTVSMFCALLKPHNSGETCIYRPGLDPMG